MTQPPSPEALAWLRQSAAFGCVTSQVLINLLERAEALEARPIPGTYELAAPTPKAALVATDEELREYAGERSPYCLRASYDLGRQHGAAQPPAAPPTPPEPSPEAAYDLSRQQATTQPLMGWLDQQSPRPAPPAGGLVEQVRTAVRRSGGSLMDDEWQVAIWEVAAWLDRYGYHGCALRLREDVARG